MTHGSACTNKFVNPFHTEYLGKFYNTVVCNNVYICNIIRQWILIHKAQTVPS